MGYSNREVTKERREVQKEREQAKADRKEYKQALKNKRSADHPSEEEGAAKKAKKEKKKSTTPDKKKGNKEKSRERIEKFMEKKRLEKEAKAEAEKQVGSLTQFYSVDFSQSRVGVNRIVFPANAQSRFASDFFTVSWVVRVPNAIHLTESLYLCSSRRNS